LWALSEYVSVSVMRWLDDEDARTDQDEVQGSFLRSAVDQTGAAEQVRGDTLVATKATSGV